MSPSKRNDIDYLLAAANRYLKTAWTEADIAGSYAGVRAMKRSDMASPSAVSRDWELKTAGNGVHYSDRRQAHFGAGRRGRLSSTRYAHNLASIQPVLPKSRPFPWAPGNRFRAVVSCRHRAGGTVRHRRRVCKMADTPPRQTGQCRYCQHLAGDRRFGRSASCPACRSYTLICCFARATKWPLHLDDLLRRRMPLLILAKARRRYDAPDRRGCCRCDGLGSNRNRS